LLLDKPADAALMKQLSHAARVWVVSGQYGEMLRRYLPGWTFASAAPYRLFTGEVWRAKESNVTTLYSQDTAQ
jgi:hypothetical protein